MVTQEDTIFVSGMDSSTTELDIEKHFGAIGVIKVNLSLSFSLSLYLLTIFFLIIFLNLFVER